MSVFSAKYILKPVVAGAIVSILDRYVLKEPELMRNVIFGGSAAISIAAISLTVPSVEKFLDGENTFTNTKSLSTRIYEIGAASGGAYFSNKYFFENNSFGVSPWKHVAVITIADIAGETASQLAQ